MSEENQVAEVIVEPVDVPEVIEAVETEPAVEKTPEELEADKKAEKKAEKKNGFEKRVQKLNDRATEARNEAIYWKNEAQKNQAKPAEPVRQAPTQEVKPLLSQYASVEDFSEAMTDYKLNQREAQSKVQATQTKAVDTYQARAAEFAKAKPDFQERLNSVSDVMFANEIHQTVLDSDVGPQIAYYLAKNQDEVERINNLSPHRRLIELGKIEDKLTEKRDNPKVKKNAPAPVTAVKGNASIANLAEKSIYEMSPEELMRARNKREGKVRK